MSEIEEHARVIATLLRAQIVQANLSASILAAMTAAGLDKTVAPLVLKAAAAGMQECPHPGVGDEIAKAFQSLAEEERYR